MIDYPKINILLSTYNGAQYLNQQLDSLLAQTYPNLTIYIRDDASTDHSFTIIKDYYNTYPDKFVILGDESNENMGYMQSFWTLLRECKNADYYAFCDQDDIWLPHKIELGINRLEKEPSNSCPLLYSSSFDYYDEHLNFTGHAQKLSSNIQLKDVLFYTPAFGFTIIINHTLKELALKPSSLHALPHDSWCQKIATSMGEFIYDPAVTTKYRRHSSTVTYANSHKLKLVIKWIKNDILGRGLSENYYIIRRFYEEYQYMLSIPENKLLSIFMAQRFSIRAYFKKLLFRRRLRPSLGGELALRVCFLLNK